jgi:hypothetical protein
MQIQVLRLYLVGLELISISLACFGIIHFSGFDVGNINGSFGVVDKKNNSKICILFGEQLLCI